MKGYISIEDMHEWICKRVVSIVGVNIINAEELWSYIRRRGCIAK